MLTKEIRERWDLTLGKVPSISNLRAAITDGTRESPCIVGLRSVSWKVKATIMPLMGLCNVC